MSSSDHSSSWIISASTEAGVLEPEEEELIHRVFEFTDLTANQVMVPRTELIGLPLTAPREEVERVLSGHGFTRYPVYDGSIDNILGIVNVKDLLPLLRDREGPLDLRRVLKTPIVMPESVRVFRLLSAMQSDRRHMVVLIDEFGGTAGVITLQDVLSEFLGEDGDEFKAAEPMPDPSPRAWSRPVSSPHPERIARRIMPSRLTHGMPRSLHTSGM